MAVEVRLPSVDHQGTLSRDRVLPAVDPELDVGSADLENNMAFPMRVEHHRVVEANEHDPSEGTVDDA